MAVAAEFLWRPNERHMEEDTDAVHILPAYELNPVMVAVSSLSGMKSGSQCMGLAVGENRTYHRLLWAPHQPLVLGVGCLELALH